MQFANFPFLDLQDTIQELICMFYVYEINLPQVKTEFQNMGSISVGFKLISPTLSDVPTNIN